MNSVCFGLAGAQSREMVWRGLNFSKMGCNCAMGDLKCLAKEFGKRQIESSVKEPDFQKSKPRAARRMD